MNYQHLYHAGNHADIFKHIVLWALLEKMKQKDKPFCYIDTHAGNGQYDLFKIKNALPEWQTGAAKLLALKTAFDQDPLKFYLLKNYADYIKNLHQFPGSPKIAEYLLRPQDEMILIEKSPQAYQDLKKLFFNQRRIHIHQADANIALNALLPPAIKRGVVLIDPPYEQKNEFDQMIILLKKSIKKFCTASYMLWYPIKSREMVNGYYRKIFREIKSMASIKTDLLALEFCPWPDDIAIRLNGSGILVINPPFEFKKTILPVLKTLILYLKQHPKGFYACFNL